MPAASSWHQDFMREQAPAPQPPQTYGGMSGYAMPAFMPPSFQHVPSAQNQQRAHLDEAAFEQAFQQAEAEDAVLSPQPAQAADEYDRPGERDPLLARIRETRPGG
jgi:hypothetical protein